MFRREARALPDLARLRMREMAMQGAAFILVRSVVPNPDDRKPFDHWYETDHLPLILSKINMTQGWRFWSHSDPSVHYALGEFSDMNELHRAASSLRPRLGFKGSDAHARHN